MLIALPRTYTPLIHSKSANGPSVLGPQGLGLVGPALAAAVLPRPQVLLVSLGAAAAATAAAAAALRDIQLRAGPLAARLVLLQPVEPGGAELAAVSRLAPVLVVAGVLGQVELRVVVLAVRRVVAALEK